VKNLVQIEAGVHLYLLFFLLFYETASLSNKIRN